MKILLSLVAGLVVVGLIIYGAGGVGTFDPAQQCKDTKAAITPGMTWEQVVAVKTPKKYRIMILEQMKIGDTVIDNWRPSAEINFTESGFKREFDKGSYERGFVFEYVFTPNDGLIIDFDGSGQVTSVREIPKLGDMFR